jgi:hypothetical protein
MSKDFILLAALPAKLEQVSVRKFFILLRGLTAMLDQVSMSKFFTLLIAPS